MRAECTIDGCSPPIHARGLCSMHYRRNRVHGDPNAVWVMRGTKFCAATDCDRPERARGYCSQHYQTWKKHGDANYVRPALRGIEIPHGTLTGYGFHGCRCVECKAVQSRTQRAHNLKKFGLTPDDYDRMWDEQGGVCLICRLASSGTLGGRLMAVDHCHTTGKVRGLLCQRCNQAIGLLHDDPDRAMALAAYLLQHADVLRKVSE